jgi:hypothetical protein
MPVRAVGAIATITGAQARHDPDGHRLGADGEMKQAWEPAVSNAVRHNELEGTQRADRSVSLLQLFPLPFP